MMSSKKNNDTRHNHRHSDEGKTDIPLNDGDIRVVPLGGVEEVGRNMSLIETKDDIIVIDVGFEFKDEEMPGIDYILPNTKYLEDRKDKIRGVLITHGHLDHIGAIPYIFDRIGNPPIYCREFTKLMILKRQEEFKDLPPLDINVVETTDEIKLGSTPVRFFGITHTIPDSMGIVIETPYGNIVNQADFKLETRDGSVTEKEKQAYEKIAEEETLLLMADSTNIENEGFSTPEWKVHKDLERLIKKAKGRLIIGAFASQVERTVKIIEYAEKHGRKVVVEGRSMNTNLGIAREAGMLEPKKGTIISAQESHDLPPERVLILATGSQGEKYAALNRMGNGTHRHLSFRPDDTVVLSSSVIPGNAISIAKLKDNISRNGPDIITYRGSEYIVHGSGHGNRAEIKWLHEKLRPKFFVPQHGRHYMLRLHEKLARKVGTPPENIVVPENGSIIDIINNGTQIVKRKKKAENDNMTVDGFNIGGVQDVVIRDRQMLAEDGIFVVIVAINPHNGELRKSPDLISRGFVYLRESQELLEDTRDLVRKVTGDVANNSTPVNFDHLKSELTDHVRKFLLKRTNKRPLVIPVVLGI